MVPYLLMGVVVLARTALSESPTRNSSRIGKAVHALHSIKRAEYVRAYINTVSAVCVNLRIVTNTRTGRFK